MTSSPSSLTRWSESDDDARGAAAVTAGGPADGDAHDPGTAGTIRAAAANAAQPARTAKRERSLMISHPTGRAPLRATNTA